MIRTLIPYAAALLAVGTVAQAALPVASLNRKTPVDFQDEILPIFRANCLACHNQTKAKADVILERPRTSPRRISWCLVSQWKVSCS